ncbi:hypothetical protein Kpol_2002p103 [Vanderwaltozyma polyspora DSM 70294]|uniref:Cytochrome c oxidase copper chaperone n=1 Tax=Vanderwaltozyma polyspora (strain ATCC 22028 / DSM 70294 / BCRC 21397 / CBS 2163 / NBRC 10782 / NRRL Y-8283 / UCD 57-17) TaxID=436907 RepID=A7TFL7_VANPO|nr:uncharacterized protein Kpol_2002p103 [Vanderwaltozyma polyspora DSM 70294]EDO19031.1 hypothetical protein Kpol_2002p103 [Vanderwaltozyma polyspora DSM 70294]
MSETKQSVNTTSTQDKPKACCVCKPEKEERDNCLLFNGQESTSCKEFIDKYKSCMKGFGFETH